MGLLRKAATATARGDTAIAQQLAPAAEPHPAPTGLLKKSISLRTAETQAPRIEPAPIADQFAPLSVELAAPGFVMPPAVSEAAAVQEPFTEELPVYEDVSEAPRVPAEEAPVAAPAPAAPEKPSDEERVAEIITTVQSMRGGVELPARLFTALSTRLSIQKGAFLLYDPMRLVYAPWASKGYDQTTLHRLRIPLGANETWNALANGSTIVVSDAQPLSVYTPFFSSREFGAVSRILLTPFITEEKLIAVLLLTDVSSPFQSDDVLLQCLTRVSETGSPLVHAARSAQLAQTGGHAPPPVSAAPEDEASRFISSFDPSIASVLLLSLSTEEFAKKIIASHEHLDPFRLHEDMRYFLGSFLTDIGRVMSVRQGVFMIGLSNYSAADVPLFLHQLSLFFHGLFGGNGRADSSSGLRIAKEASWPADGQDMRALIESLSG